MKGIFQYTVQLVHACHLVVDDGCTWINTQSNNGIIPLHMAFKNEQVNVNEYLVQTIQATYCSHVSHLSEI